MGHKGIFCTSVLMFQLIPLFVRYIENFSSQPEVSSGSHRHRINQLNHGLHTGIPKQVDKNAGNSFVGKRPGLSLDIWSPNKNGEIVKLLSYYFVDHVLAMISFQKNNFGVQDGAPKIAKLV